MIEPPFTVNPVNYMTVVTVSSHGAVAAKHLGCKGLSQPFLLETNSEFLLLGHTRSVLGSLLVVVLLLDNLTVPSTGRPVKKLLVVEKKKLT